MKNFAGILISFLIALSTGWTKEEATTLPANLTLREAVRLSLIHHPGLQQMAERIVERDGELRGITAAERPSFKVTADYNRTEEAKLQSFGSMEAPDPNNWHAAAETSVSIFSGGQNKVKRQVAVHRREADEAALASYRSELIAAVHQAYYDAQLAREEAAVQTEAISVLTEQLKIAEKKFQFGTGAKFDVTQAKVALANAKPPLIRAQNNYRRQIDLLRRRIGLPFAKGEKADAIQLAVYDKLEAIELDIEKALEQAIRRRPELAEAAALEKAGQEEIERTRRATRPVASVFANYGFENDPFGQEDLLKGYTAGLRLNWPIFDGGLNKANIDQATSRLTSLQQRKREVKLNIEGELRQAFFDYSEARSILNTTILVVDEAHEALEMARNRYEAGKGTQLDVLESQLQLTKSRMEAATALNGLLQSQIQMKRVTGVQLEIPDE